MLGQHLTVLLVRFLCSNLLLRKLSFDVVPSRSIVLPNVSIVIHEASFSSKLTTKKGVWIRKNFKRCEGGSSKSADYDSFTYGLRPTTLSQIAICIWARSGHNAADVFSSNWYHLNVLWNRFFCKYHFPHLVLSDRNLTVAVCGWLNTLPTQNTAIDVIHPGLPSCLTA